MDFSTMRKKLQDHEYLSVADMEEDFNRIASEVFKKAKEQEKVGLFDISPEPDLSSTSTNLPSAIVSNKEATRTCDLAPSPSSPVANAAQAVEQVSKTATATTNTMPSLKSRQSTRPVPIALSSPAEIKPSEMRSRLRSRGSDQVSPTTASSGDTSSSQTREPPLKRRRISVAATASHNGSSRLRRSTAPAPLRLTPAHGLTTPVAETSEGIPSRGRLTSEIASPTDAANLLAKGAGTTTGTVSS
ncbi:unnamed protein product, partial [Dibothriocephalus latus]